jgi:hypothetical protein
MTANIGPAIASRMTYDAFVQQPFRISALPVRLAWLVM